MQAAFPLSVGIASCTGHATRAGQIMAENGGNAFDAAVACAFNLLVSNPLLCSLGGSGFATVKRPGESPVVIDFFSAMPGKGLPQNRFGKNKRVVEVAYGPGVEIIAGHAAAGVPGTAKGLLYLARNYGTMPVSDLIQPAVEDALKGVPVNRAVALWLSVSAKVHHWATPYCKQLLSTEAGEVPDEGYPLKNPDLARTLQSLAEEGEALIYRGDIARQIVETIQEGGGLITMQDMAEYDLALRRPVETGMAGYRIFSNPPPSVGGCTLVQLLKVVERRRFDRWSPESVALFAQILETAFKNRFAFITADDPDFARLYCMIEDNTVMDTYQAILSSPHTTQVSTVDSLGNACSITMSMGYGSGVAIPGTGILMDNILGELELNPFGFHGLKPGSRLVSNMSPTIATTADGSDLIALGTPGASRITSALGQVLINLIVLEMSLQDALSAPRVHWEEDQVLYEPGVELDDSLLPAHWQVKPFESRHMYFGGVQAVRLSQDCGLEACSDPRRDGLPMVVER